jgi:hypothetical protein
MKPRNPRATVTCLAATLAAVLCSGTARAGELEDLAAEARGIITGFSAQLQAELQSAIAAGGFENAIGVCSTRAPALAAAASRDGWHVGRTSLKVRNPANNPDEFERRVLLDFEQKLADGRTIESLGYYQMNAVGERTEFRYMKAIETQDLCLGCHGAAIAPAVARRLDEIYPEDQARGYAAGQLRGAFTLTRHFLQPDAE